MTDAPPTTLSNAAFVALARNHRANIKCAKKGYKLLKARFLKQACPREIGDTLPMPGAETIKVIITDRKIDHYLGDRYRWVFVCAAVETKHQGTAYVFAEEIKP